MSCVHTRPRLGRLVAAATFVMLAAGATAQPAPLADPAAGPAARPGPWGGPRDMAATTALTGTVARWLTNPDGDVDGMLLADGTQVSFPPHLSAGVTEAVKLNDAVRLDGWREGAVFRATTISGGASGRVVRDDGPPAGGPARREPGALQEMAATGQVTTLLRGPRGEVNGVLLQSGELVRFPPHVGQQYAAVLQQGAMVSARGYGTRNAYGTTFEATAMGENANSLRAVYGPPRPGVGPAGVRP